MKLLTIAEARARMLDGVRPLSAESVSIQQAPGRVLAEAIVAPRDQPPFNSSAMDGWAVRRADALNAAVDLEIVGDSSAGHGFEGKVGPSEAVRIFTGAALPDGADMVVIQEDAAQEGAKVRVGPLKGEVDFVRAAGGDFHKGDVLLEPGVRLDAWRLSLAAAAGRATVEVSRRPRVAVLCTGEELVRAPDVPGRFQIYESNSAGLCALIESWGGLAQRLEPARDEEAAVIDALADLDVDLIVTVGGASVGDYDVVKPALGKLGLELKVASVNIRPGKPTWFGTLGDGRRVLGLPGNPTSALVCAELFVRSLVLALQGADPEPPLLNARLVAPLAANGSRGHLMRAKLTSSQDGVLLVEPFADQDSGMTGVIARADALVIQPAKAPAAEIGETVQILRLQRL